MKFTKEFLLDILDNILFEEDVDGVIVVENKIIEHSRWSVHHRMVFKHDGKFYQSFWQAGATESQDESPYEYEDDEIECKEVFPHEKVITYYE